MIIDDLLRDAKMSQYKLSKESGVAQATISDICSRKTTMKKCAAGTLYRIAKTLNVTAGFSVQNEKSQIVLNTSINSISCVPFSILPMIYQYFWRVRLAKPE